jgi:hypothetical protein
MLYASTCVRTVCTLLNIRYMEKVLSTLVRSDVQHDLCASYWYKEPHIFH